MRSELLTRLQCNQFDLLIIGGGIVGAGIARDAAMRSLKVALIEQGDFGSGTSSKTSKLIHGGLRYLEHGHLRLVQEGLRERKLLQTIAPGLINPLQLLLPVYAGDARPAWKMRAGLVLYDILALGRQIQTHRILSSRKALALEPALSGSDMRLAGLYADCQMDDARVCLANILQAIQFGAVCCNYVRLREFLNSGNHIHGGIAQDSFTGRTFEIRAKVVVNATGPWSDKVRWLSDTNARQCLTPTKGIHIIVPCALRYGLFAQTRKDARMIFLLPWGAYTLIGTTETPIDGSVDGLCASNDEVSYLLEEANRILPNFSFKEENIISTYAGARPLLVFSGTSTQASREHRIEIDRFGLVSVMGGKFTTYRLMAQQVVDFVVRKNRWKAEQCLSDQVSLFDVASPIVLDHWRDLTRKVEKETLSRLLIRYGTGTFHILRLLERDPGLMQPVCPHHDCIEAELAYAFCHELSCTIADVLFRRTRIALSHCQGLDFSSTISRIAQQYGGISDQSAQQQLRWYKEELSKGLAFRSKLVAQEPIHLARKS